MLGRGGIDERGLAVRPPRPSATVIRSPLRTRSRRCKPHTTTTAGALLGTEKPIL